jgi:hypothetical protein
MFFSKHLHHPRMLFWSLMSAFCLQEARADVIIDDFDTYQSITVAGPPAGPASTFASQLTLEALGGERDVMLARTSSNSGAVAVDISGSVVSQLSYASAPFTTGGLLLVYDGVDGSATLNYTGLGGLDLTQSGVNTGILLRSVSDLGSSLTFTIYTDATRFSTATLPILADPSFTFADYFTPFLSFTALGVNGGANFANVGAITLELDGSTAGTDVSLETIAAAPTPVPEPAGAFLIACAGLSLILRRGRQHAMRA